MVLVESQMRQSTSTSLNLSCSARNAFTTAQYFNFKRTRTGFKLFGSFTICVYNFEIRLIAEFVEAEQ